MHRLLEHLHHGDAAHVFHGRLVHAVERVLVEHHERHATFFRPTPHHPPHHERRDGNGNEAHKPHDPVEREHDRHECHRGDERPHEVGQLVRKHVLGLTGAAVHHAPQMSRGVGVEVAERHAAQVAERLLAHVRRRAERRQVGAHERREVHQQARCRERERKPAPEGKPLRSAPVGSHGHEVAQHEPHAHQGHDREDAIYARKDTPQDRELLARAREPEQSSDGLFGARRRHGHRPVSRRRAPAPRPRGGGARRRSRPTGAGGSMQHASCRCCFCHDASFLSSNAACRGRVGSPRCD